MGLTRQGVIEQYSHCKKSRGGNIGDISATRLSPWRPYRLSAPPSRMVKYYRLPPLCLLEFRVKHNNENMSTQLRHKDIKKGLSVDYEGTCINICADPNRQQRFCLAGAVVMPFSVKNSATPVRVSPPLLGLTQFESWHRKW